MKIRKFNESENYILTWGNLKEIVENGDVQLVNMEMGDFLDSMENQDLEQPLYRKAPTNGLQEVDELFVIVFDKNSINYDMNSIPEPIAVIGEYEIMNPFVFGDVVIVPGHDSITCFNMNTGESTTSYIR